MTIYYYLMVRHFTIIHLHRFLFLADTFTVYACIFSPVYTGFSLSACIEVRFCVGQVYIMYFCHLSNYQKKLYFLKFLRVQY